jgi:cystathionine beta-lyase
LRAAFVEAMGGIVPHVNVMGYAAAQAAYVRHNRDLVGRRISTMPGLTMTHVEATYLAWVDTRATRLADPVGFFEAAAVGLSDGTDFGAPGYVRLREALES